MAPMINLAYKKMSKVSAPCCFFRSKKNDVPPKLPKDEAILFPLRDGFLLTSALHTLGADECILTSALHTLDVDGYQRGDLQIPTYTSRLEEASQNESIGDVFSLFNEMAHSPNKKVFAAEGLIVRAQTEWERLSEAKLAAFKLEHRSVARADPDMCLALASSPEIGCDGDPVLAMATHLVEAAGGSNIAGTIADWFHKHLMDQNNMEEGIMLQKVAWQSKLEAVLSKSCPVDQPDKSITLFSLKGGWKQEQEQKYLEEFRKTNAGKKICVVCLQNIEELISYLEKLQISTYAHHLEKAIQNERMGDVLALFNEMADAPNKQAFVDKGLLEKAETVLLTQVI
mmetsp:Transcript_9209/g.15079  ORF Transcript_9209/g.15079 Transcript_9209/m.15079 type:complete len:342 (-) Transcript_9209:537-1562(-)